MREVMATGIRENEPLYSKGRDRGEVRAEVKVLTKEKREDLKGGGTMTKG